MANGVFNIAKGKVNEYVTRVDGNDPANSALIVVLLSAAESDSTLQDYDTLAALLAGSNTEATFTNYARKVITDSDGSLAVAVDDTNNRADADFSDQTWSTAGGATNNTLVKAIICYDSDTTAGTDANIVPLTHHDFAVTTDGSDLTMQLPSGFFRAA